MAFSCFPGPGCMGSWITSEMEPEQFSKLANSPSSILDHRLLNAREIAGFDRASWNQALANMADAQALPEAPGKPLLRGMPGMQWQQVTGGVKRQVRRGIG